MKLLFCSECHDVVKLLSAHRTCQCGRSWGNYKNDKEATIGGKAIPLGIGNGTFVEALKGRPLSGLGYRFTAFVIPHFCNTIEEVRNK